MGRKSVAVLDVRSSEITVLVGEKGVNNTFVFTAMKTVAYSGYDSSGFFEPDALGNAVVTAVCEVEKICNERIKRLYVGVPGEFAEVRPKECFAGFPKKIRIGQKEIDSLFESGQEEIPGYRRIHATSMIYFTGDNRNVVNPIGLHSATLRAVLCYFYCEERYAKTFEDIFRDMKVELRFLPTNFAMASYLIPGETRDEYSLFLDAGYLSSTVSVLLGGGVLAQRTFWAGRGQIEALVMDRLNVPYDVACALVARANLYTKRGQKNEFLWRGETYDIDTDKLIDVVKEGLDQLCEQIAGFLDECSARELDFKPLYISGEGVTAIRGALEHVSKRISRVCELLVPDLPYYNKPSMSSRIGLVDLAYELNRKNSGLFGFFTRFGG